MPQPTPYTRQANFTEHTAAYPSEPHEGTALDAEFNALRTTLVGVLSNMLKLQRDDGKLKNAAVTIDSLGPDVLLLLASGIFTIRGTWSGFGIDYVVGDLVKSFGTSGGGMVATYICNTAHKSLVNWNDNLARWTKIFDESGSIPEDGSVTEEKLADGAVTEDKIGFDQLDLSGSIRGGGIAAGSAPFGALMHAKKDVGDVYVKAERATDGQGNVGFQVISASAIWSMQLGVDTNDLQLVAGAAPIVSFYDTGGTDVVGAIRATAGLPPTAGAGAALNYVGGVGYLQSYDYDAVAWKDLKVRGKDVYLSASGVDTLKATSTSVNFLVPPTYLGDALGYLGIPQVIDNDARELSNADNGFHIYSENVAGQTITIPKDMGGAVDFATLIINDGTSPIALNAGHADVIIKLAGGATGNRTIAAGGWAFVKRVKTNRYFVGGKGTS